MPKCGCNDKDKTEKIAKEAKAKGTRTDEKKSPSKPPKDKS